MCYLHYVLFVLLFGLEIAAQTNVLLCEKGDHENLTCQPDHVIIIQEVTASHKGNCGSWNSKCANFMNNNIRNECNSKTSCNASYETVRNPCENLPRQMDISYDCKVPWWIPSVLEYSKIRKPVCISSLSEVSCGFPLHIEIKSVYLPTNFVICGYNGNDCILRELKHLCDNRRRCSASSNRRKSCLFYDKFALVSFDCADNSTTLPTYPSIDEVSLSTSTPSSTPLGNDNDGRTQSTYPFPEYVPNIEITIDNSDRVLFNPNGQRFVLCVDRWNNYSASLVSRHLSISQNCSAKTVENSADYDRLPVVPNCNGSESYITECDFINATCSSSMVAGIECFEDQENSSSKTNGQIIGSSALGIGIGASLGSVTVLVVALLVLLCMRRRNLKSKEKQPRSHIGNRCDDYTRQQGIALPNVSNGSPDNHTVQYTSCPGFDIETNQNNGHFLRSKPNSSPSQPGEVDQSTYATSQDGIYDKTHDRRHVENEANTYGYSVDGVYDTSNHQQGYDVDGSSYGRVVDTVYDTSVHNSSSKGNLDDTYARAVDTAYDTASRLGTIGRQDDAYD